MFPDRINDPRVEVFSLGGYPILFRAPVEVVRQALLDLGAVEPEVVEALAEERLVLVQLWDLS